MWSKKQLVPISAGKFPTGSKRGKTCDPFQARLVSSAEKCEWGSLRLDSILLLIGLKRLLFWFDRAHHPVYFSTAGYNCGGIRTQVAGVISSSNFPSYYKSNTTCVWTISVNTANQITLNFTDFELENSSRCEHAYVQVYDGPNTTDPSLGTFCGGEIPTGVRSSGNQMLVVFQGYRGNKFKGFRAYYDSGKYFRSHIKTKAPILRLKPHSN